MLRTRIILAAAPAAFLVGCVDGRVASNVDPWADANPPRQVAYGADERSTEIDPTRVYVVIAEKWADADGLLEREPAVPLTAARAAELIGHELIGHDLADVPGTAPYLVRGVRLDGDYDGLTVRQWADGGVSIYTYAVAYSARRMGREPLVVQLDRPPTNAYLHTARSW